MKIRMLKDADHRVRPAVWQAFRAGKIYSVPRQTGEALIRREAAIPDPQIPKETSDV